MNSIKILLALCLSLAFAVPTNMPLTASGEWELVSAIKTEALKASPPIPKKVRFKAGIPSERVALRHIDPKTGAISFVPKNKKGQKKVPEEFVQYLSPLGYVVKTAFHLTDDEAEAVNRAYQRLKTGKRYEGEPPTKPSKPSPDSVRSILKAPTDPIYVRPEEEEVYEFFFTVLRALGRRKRSHDNLDKDALLDIKHLGKLLHRKYESGKEMNTADQILLKHLLAENGYHHVIV